MVLSRAFSFFLSVAILLTIWRVRALFGLSLDLSFDEAQYWLWSLKPDFGYYSKPPMVAWAIALSTKLCGDAEACIRLPSSLAYLFGAIFIFLAARDWFDEKIAFWSGLAYLTLPAASFSSILITTDPFLLMFWAVGMWTAGRALRGDGFVWWLGVGLAIGLGMLSKYAMLFFVAGLGLFILWERRDLLRKPGPWAALLLGGLIYLPNYFWNLANGMASYKHTQDNANLGGKLFNIGKTFEFLGAQFAVFGPVFFAVLLLVIFTWRKTTESERGRFFFSLLLPLFLVMTVQSFLSRANANWGAPVYVSGSILVIAWLIEHNKEWLLRFSLILHVMVAALLYDAEGLMQLSGIAPKPLLHAISRLHGWDDVGAEVSRKLKENPDATLLTEDRKMSATLSYYVRPQSFSLVKWNTTGKVRDTFELTTSMKDKKGKNFLLASDLKTADHISQRFESARLLSLVRVKLPDGGEREVRIWRLDGFKGYFDE